MELLSRDRTICGGLFAAQRVRNRRLSKPNTVVIRRAGYGALGRLDRVRGVRFLRLTRRAADRPAQPEMTRSGCRDPNQLGSGGVGEAPRSGRQRSGNFILSALASPTVTLAQEITGNDRTTITRGLVGAKH